MNGTQLKLTRREWWCFLLGFMISQGLRLSEGQLRAFKELFPEAPSIVLFSMHGDPGGDIIFETQESWWKFFYGFLRAAGLQFHNASREAFKIAFPEAPLEFIP